MFILNIETDRWGLQRKESRFTEVLESGPTGPIPTGLIKDKKTGTLLRRTQFGWIPTKSVKRNVG